MFYQELSCESLLIIRRFRKFMPKTGSHTPCLLFISGVLLPSLLFRTQLYDVSKWSVYSEVWKLSYRFFFRILKRSGVLNSHPFKDPDPWLHFTSARLKAILFEAFAMFSVWRRLLHWTTFYATPSRSSRRLRKSDIPNSRVPEETKQASLRIFGSSGSGIRWRGSEDGIHIAAAL